MHIGIIGAGYVGLVTAVGLASKGNDVICFDIDEEKVKKINNKIPPIFEVGLKESLEELVPEKLTATLQFEEMFEKSEVIFICVNTPTEKDGSQNISRIKNVAEKIGLKLVSSKVFKVIIVKSTVLPQVTRNVVQKIIEEKSKKKVGIGFGIAFNPEFLREGHALNDFLYPDRVILGVCDEKSEKILYNLYSEFAAPVLVTTVEAAEMIKYANNCFLTTKISFINEIGAICKALNIDTYEVAKGMGMDKRIGPAFLRAGLGWGGSCFPKDSAALVKLAKELNLKSEIVNAAIEINKRQPQVVVDFLKKFKVKKVAVLGLTFKADTDDIRDSQAIPLIELLLKNNYEVAVFDPKGMDNFKNFFGKEIAYAKDAQSAIALSECVIIATDWYQFEHLNYGDKIVIDTRNVISKENRSKNYYGVYW